MSIHWVRDDRAWLSDSHAYHRKDSAIDTAGWGPDEDTDYLCPNCNSADYDDEAQVCPKCLFAGKGWAH